jgi:hypothetical protein
MKGLYSVILAFTTALSHFALNLLVLVVADRTIISLHPYLKKAWNIRPTIPIVIKGAKAIRTHVTKAQSALSIFRKGFSFNEFLLSSSSISFTSKEKEGV